MYPSPGLSTVVYLFVCHSHIPRCPPRAIFLRCLPCTFDPPPINLPPCSAVLRSIVSCIVPLHSIFAFSSPYCPHPLFCPFYVFCSVSGAVPPQVSPTDPTLLGCCHVMPPVLYNVLEFPLSPTNLALLVTRPLVPTWSRLSVAADISLLDALSTPRRSLCGDMG